MAEPLSLEERKNLREILPHARTQKALPADVWAEITERMLAALDARDATIARLREALGDGLRVVADLGAVLGGEYGDFHAVECGEALGWRERATAILGAAVENIK